MALTQFFAALAGFALALFLGRPLRVSTGLALLIASSTLASAQGQGQGQAPAPADSAYVGSAACAACHAKESAVWAKSHHAAAMAPATPATVRGDFSGASAESHGSKGRFLREGERFIVETEGRDGRTARFDVSHTFGIEPLQQYLVTFPDGRLQALPWAWDTRPKEAGGNRWLHLYPDQEMPSADPLHWTGPMQNWNFMCAECHTTDLHKNYDAATDRFQTRFFEAGVGCESCHGPAKAHVDWAKGAHAADVPNKGFASVHARRPKIDWAPDPASGSPKQSAARPAGDEVELCAHCHARRGQFAENWRPGQSLTQTHLPSFLTPELFEDDGQMKDEVFNDHSFKQSLMYAKGVICTDCHDPHSGRLKTARAEVCSQCHQPEKFASTAHSGHANAPNAPDCIACHMPVRRYMVVDDRHDHSFRIPRPDLSVAFGAPNSCNDCHKDRTANWAAQAIEKWHGPNRKGFQTWTEALHRARKGEPAARELLLRLINEPATPAVARATAIVDAQRLNSGAVTQATSRALADPDPLVRIAALRAQANMAAGEARWRVVGPLLADPVKAVRLEAAATLADENAQTRAPDERRRLEAAWDEYEASLKLNADRPEGRANLGSFYARRGRPDAAEAEYLAGLKLAPRATPLSVNLADLYRALGKESESEKVLRQAIAAAPDAGAAHHALGLALVRQKRYDEALTELRKAVELAPDDARFAYVEIVALLSLDPAAARARLEAALRRFPFEPNLLRLELQHALQASDVDRAAAAARTLADLLPDDSELAALAAKLRGQ